MKREAPEDLQRVAKRARSPGQPASGRIVSWYPQKGYGFIQSPVAQKDVFFPKVALPTELQEQDFNQLKGLEVSFEFLELDGKPRAQMVSVKGSRPIPAARPMRAQPGPPPMERFEPQGHLPIHTGTIRSYDAKKGFGFLSSDRLNEDVFYLRSELPPELDGIEPRRDQVVERRVDFEVRQMENGKLRAQRLRFLPMIPAAPAPPARPGPSGRETYNTGRIRSFYPSKGYGFIECPGLADLFFLPSSLPKELVESRQPLEGMEISFEAFTNEEGKPRARNIQPLSSRGPLPRAPAPPHMVPMLPLAPGVPGVPGVPGGPAKQAEPRIMAGTIHIYDANKGFGFMRAEGVSGDIFFSRSELPPEFKELEKDQVVGKHMEFEMKVMPDGKLRALKLLALRRLGVPRGRGRVAKYHQDKGYGFMDTGWSDNVFFLRSSLPKDLNDATLEELQPLEISFELSSKEPNKPRASNLEVVGREKPLDVAPEHGEVVLGEIVNYDPVKGFGFIRPRGCSEDVYFMRSELPPELSVERKEEVIGERVELQVLVKPDGKLRAQDIRLLPREGEEPESDLEPDLVQEMEDFLLEHGNRENYGNFTNRFPRVKKGKIQKHFIISDAGGKQFVELPLDHPRRLEEAMPEMEEREERIPADHDFPDDFPETAPMAAVDEVAPDEPAIPLGPGLESMGVIRDYDANKGYGFIRCSGLDEDVFFPRTALPKSFQGQNIRDMPQMKGVQVGFEYNPSSGRGPRADVVRLLLRWLPADRCWILKRGPIPAKGR